MNEKIKEIKKLLKLNDVELADYLKMSKMTLYKHMRDGKWHPHQESYINLKHQELLEIHDKVL